MNTLRIVGCFLIGWDKNILKECGEASLRQYRKLLSAICIMMVLWGTIGYCFADRYINIESFVLKVCVFRFYVYCTLCGTGDNLDSWQSALDESYESTSCNLYGYSGFQRI